MKIIKLTGILIFLFISTSLQAQNKEMLEKYAVLKGDVLRVEDEAYTGKVDGSPYYLPEFQTGYLNISKHEPLAAKVRYDIVKEQMQISLGPDNYKVIDHGIVVDINQTKFKFLPFRWKGDNLKGYFEILSDAGNETPVTLLRKHFKEIETGTRSQARGFEPKYDDDSELFLLFKGAQKPIASESSQKKFLELFPAENRAQLEEFMDSNNLKPRKTEDVIKIVAFYNSNFGQDPS